MASFFNTFWKPQHYERQFLWQFLTKRPQNEAFEAMTTLKLQLPMITEDLFRCCAGDLTRFLPIYSIFRWIFVGQKKHAHLFVYVLLGKTCEITSSELFLWRVFTIWNHCGPCCFCLHNSFCDSSKCYQVIMVTQMKILALSGTLVATFRRPSIIEGWSEDGCFYMDNN